MMSIYLRKHLPLSGYFVVIGGITCCISKREYRLLSKFLTIKEF